MNYIAEIQHSKETFQRLAKVQHNEYGLVFKFAMMIVGTVSLLIAVSTGVDNTFSILLLFTGGLAFSGLNMPAQRNADKLISMANGDFPRTKYIFLEKEVQITTSDTTSSLEYVKVYDLLEDNDYYFLFLNRFSGYMVPKNAIFPADAERFSAFLEDKIGLKLYRTTGLLSHAVRARLKRYKARKKREV